MVYGFGFDKVDTKTLERLQSPVPVIAGGEDTGATQAAVTFSPPLGSSETAVRNIHLSGCGPRLRAITLQSYNPEAVRITCVLVQDFLATHLGPDDGPEKGPSDVLLEILENRGDYRAASLFLKVFHHHVRPRHREDWLHRGHSHHPTRKMNLAATPSELR
jgi:hypothetical protein